MDDFEKDLSKVFPLYCLLGEEKFRIDQAIKSLKQNFQTQIEYEGEKATPISILTVVRTQSIFGSNKKLVVVKYPIFSDWDCFEYYFKNPSKDVCLVFVSPKYSIPTKLQKIFQKNGRILKFSKIQEYKLTPYVKDIFKVHGKSVSDKEVVLLIKYLGNDLQEINSEVQKLCIYVGDRAYVTTKDIQLVLEKSRIGSVFELLTNMMDQKIKALNLLSGLLESGEGEFGVLVMISRELKKMNDIKKFDSIGVTKVEIGKRVGIHPYFLNSTIEKAKSVSWERLRKLYELIVWTERAFKYKKTSNRILLEKLILEV